eukprot:TRINITY_DN22756_c0_g1_i1.p1 TRINITY_DN22756_c0_g1~~TRINITY_DN22756_c0_g1_i1.p1  ORF type:complete len:561 (+),score=127.12 TRINITY_DN22756_c0_g1_i1:80-1762(+)
MALGALAPTFLGTGVTGCRAPMLGSGGPFSPRGAQRQTLRRAAKLLGGGTRRRRCGWLLVGSVGALALLSLAPLWKGAYEVIPNDGAGFTTASSVQRLRRAVRRAPGSRTGMHAASVASAAEASASAEASGAEEGAKSSVGQSTVNLVKNIVGAGMLSLPAGVAAYGGSPEALAPALVAALTLGVLSGYGFVLIADACSRTGETTYQGAWAKAVSPRTSWLPAAACCAKAAIGCISFSMILADCLSRILEPLQLPAALAARGPVMVALTASVLFPLCTMKSLAPLAKFSFLGVLSNVYICAFVLLRCFDGSYSVARSGSLLPAAPVAPSFAASAGAGGPLSLAAQPGFLVLLSILATAFLAHYNAPLFYEQLAPDANGDKAGRFLAVSLLGFGAAAVIFSVVMVGGFLTFGKSSLGLILNNYAATDPLASLARGAVLLSLVTAYPLVFLSLRKQVLSVLPDDAKALAEKRPRFVALVLLSAVTAVALSLRDLGKLAAFAGAAFGSFLIYVAPAVMVLSAQRRGLGPKPRGAGGALARSVQLLLIPLGLALGALGAMQSLK